MKEETKLKISVSKKGQLPWITGRKHTPETKAKMKLAKVGHIPWNKGTHGKMNIWNKGIKIDKEKYPDIGHTKKHSEETKKKMSEKATGRKHSKERNKKISEAMKVRIIKPETIEKLKNRCGSKNPNWKEQKADRKYAVDWTKTLKRSIRERDKYVCRLCGEPQTDKAHAVHHIDYNKYNCSPNNLITLCQKCHGKTNYNREKYIINFKNINL